MKRPCQKILLASAFGAALAACGSIHTSTDNNGLIENNTDAAGVSAGEASSLYGASGTGTRTAPPTDSSTNNGTTRY